MRRVLFAVLPLALVASASAASAPTGLHGTVLRGPTAPVCRVDQPCEAPAAGVVLTFSGAGLARATRTDAQGAFGISLPPGTYSVRTDQRPFGTTPHPPRVHVRAGHSDAIVFTIDTGIR